MTVLIKQKSFRIYYDKSLAAIKEFKGRTINNDEDMFIGRGFRNNRIGFPGARFDNIQIFNNALTIDEITILALANKDVITD